MSNLPTYKSSINRAQKGIFMDNQSEEDDDEVAQTSMEYTKRIYNMFFPV